MGLEQRLFTQQKQTIAITAQVIQSITLLQYGQDELRDFVREQAEKNPLIEVQGDNDGALAGSSDDAGGRVEQAGADKTARNSESSTAPDGASRMEANQGGSLRPASSGGGSGTGEAPSLENYCSSPVTLREHLLSQVAMSFRDPVEQMIGAEIVESVDPDGYLRRDLDDIAEVLNVDERRVEDVLGVVHGFEPTGVAARNLAECLKLQMEDVAGRTPAMAVLLENLNLLADCNFDKLSRLCRVRVEDIMEMQEQIRALDPRPGRQFDSDQAKLALPDVLVRRGEDGNYAVEMNSALLPRVLIDREYHAEIISTGLNEDEKRFVTDCMSNANWIVRSLDQRAKTILRVSSEIVARQREFFEKGAEFLRPLSLKDIATELDIHESTVCRATSNKYMMTDRGMFELKSFFVNSIASNDGGDDVSTESVRHRIREMIGAEKPEAILSDQEIMDRLQDEGIDIARRTVAKYREMMNIPTSVKRKRLRKAEGLTPGRAMETA